jgi:hypothetical protein
MLVPYRRKVYNASVKYWEDALRRFLSCIRLFKKLEDTGINLIL